METLVKRYRQLGIANVPNYDTLNHIAIVHHSTAIEGSTLTEVETTVLIQDGLTPRGKPLAHSLMVQDHFDALNFVLDAAAKKTPLSIPLIQRIAARVLKHTGAVYQTVFGEVDASQGAFRRGNVYAGESYFPGHEKVPQLMATLLAFLQHGMGNPLSTTDALNLSFDAHFKPVSIHPFYDGNGRTARLLMNYVQHYYDLPLAIVPASSRVDYFQALIDARKQDDLNLFRTYMAGEYRTCLLREIQKFELVNPA